MSNVHKRGFASLSPERRREIASLGGKSARRAHRWSAEEARKAGRKGGNAVSQDRAHMAEIGRKGGLAHSREHLARIGRLGGQRRASGRQPVQK
jgi:general stress protein YciG